MTEAGTLCTQPDVAKMAGANANTTAVAEPYTNVYILETEGEICGAARYDFVTNYASLSSIGKEWLRSICAAGSAIKVIANDMSGYYTNVNEAMSMINILYSIFVNGIKKIENNVFLTFVIDGTGQS